MSTSSERIKFWEDLWFNSKTPEERVMITALARESGEEHESLRGLLRSTFTAEERADDEAAG